MRLWLGWDYQDSVSRSQVEVRCECLGLTGKRVVSDFYRRHSSAERAAGCLYELGPALFSSVRLDLQDVCSALDFPPSRSHSASSRQKNSYGRKPTAAADIRLSSFTVEASSCFCRLCWKTPDSFLMYTRRQSLGIEQDVVDDEWKYNLFFCISSVMTDGSASFHLQKETVSYCWSTASEDKDVDVNSVSDDRAELLSSLLFRSSPALKKPIKKIWFDELSDSGRSELDWENSVHGSAPSCDSDCHSFRF